MSILKWTCRHHNYSTLPQIKHFFELNTYSPSSVALLFEEEKKPKEKKKEATKKLPD